MIEPKSIPVVQQIADILYEEKIKRHPDSCMVVGIEGLSNSGKSTFAKMLGDMKPTKFQDRKPVNYLILEGDLFHRGRNKARPAYQEMIAKVEAGGDVPDDFMYRIWDYDKLYSTILVGVARFNASEKEATSLVLHDVLDAKIDGTEHDQTIPIDRNTIIVIPCMYLRHIEGFDYFIFLHGDVDRLIDRKIERTKEIKDFDRGETETRKMVMLVEWILMNTLQEEMPPQFGATVDVNDFANMTITRNE